jgi:hypothetical protein
VRPAGVGCRAGAEEVGDVDRTAPERDALPVQQRGLVPAALDVEEHVVRAQVGVPEALRRGDRPLPRLQPGGQLRRLGHVGFDDEVAVPVAEPGDDVGEAVGDRRRGRDGARQPADSGQLLTVPRSRVQRRNLFQHRSAVVGGRSGELIDGPRRAEVGHQQDEPDVVVVQRGEQRLRQCSVPAQCRAPNEWSR